MSEPATHLSPQQLRGYRNHTLSPAELVEVGAHLEGCSQCRGAASEPDDLEAAYGAFRPETAEAHLTPEEIAAHVEGALSGEDLARARTHLGACEKCRMADNDLRAFQAEVDEELAAVPARRHSRWATLFLWLTVPTTATGLAAALFFAYQVNTLQQQLRQEQARSGSLADLEQRAASLETEKGRLEQENARLTDRVPTLQRESETLRKEKQGLEEQLRLARATSPDAVIRDGSGVLILGPDGAPVRVKETEPLPQLASAALRTGELPLPPELAELLPPAQVTRGGGSRFQVHGPAGTRVLTPQPAFQWEPVPKADRYEVVLTAKAEGAVPLEYDAGEKTSWTPPEPLRRGARYEWQVRAYTGDELLGTAPQAPDRAAVFEVLTAEQAVQLERELAAASGSPLQRAAALARAGLLPEAEKELDAVVRANPGSARVSRLRESLRAARQPKPAGASAIP